MSKVTDEDMKVARAFVVDIIDSPTPEYRDEVERDLAAAFAEGREKAYRDGYDKATEQYFDFQNEGHW